MLFEFSEKDGASTLHNLKLSGRSEVQTHLSRKQASSTKQEHIIQPSPINVEKFTNWPDIVFRYYEDTDNFALYFIKASPGVIEYCDNATDDILVSYTHDDKIVSIDIDGISETLQCHMIDTRDVIDEKPPLTLTPIYDEELDTLKIYFNLPSMSTLENNPVESDIEDIKVERDNTRRITCILFRNASKRIANPISEEKRKELARISKKKAKEFTKDQYEIVKKYLIK